MDNPQPITTQSESKRIVFDAQGRPRDNPRTPGHSENWLTAHFVNPQWRFWVTTDSGDRHHLICFDLLWAFHKALDGRKKRNFSKTMSVAPQPHPELRVHDKWTYSLAALQGKWKIRPMVTAKVEEINATRICTRPPFGNDSVFFEVRSLCCVWCSSGGKVVNVAKAPRDL